MRWQTAVGGVLVFCLVLGIQAADETLPPGAVARLGNDLLRPAHGPVSFSRDGQRIICPPSAFDAATGKRLGELAGIQSQGGTFAYSDDGQWLAIGKREYPVAKVEIWDTRRNQIVETLTGNFPAELAFSSDGRLLFASAEQSGGVRVWKFLPGRSRVLAEATGRGVMSRDGRWLATWSESEVTVRQLADQQVAWQKTVKPAVAVAMFSPDGQRLFVADVEGGLQTLAASTGERIAAFTLPAPPADPTTTDPPAEPEPTVIGISSDGQFVVTSHKQQLCVWNTESRRLSRSLPVEAAPETLAFAPTGNRFAVRCRNHGTLRIIDAETGEEPLAADGPQSCRLVFSADDRLIATDDRERRRIDVWDATTGQRVETYPLAAEQIQFSRDGTHLFVVQLDRMILLDRRDGKRVEFPSPIRAGQARFAVSPNERLLAVAFERSTYDGKTFTTEGVVQIIDLVEQQLRKSLDHSCQLLQFTPDGNHLAIASRVVPGERPPTTRELAVHETTTWREILRLKDEVDAVAFTADGQRMAVAIDKHHRLLEFPSGKLVVSHPHDRGTNLLRFVVSEVGREQLLTGSSLLRLADGERIALPLAYSVAVTDDNRFAWGADQDLQSVTQVDLGTGRVKARWSMGGRRVSRIFVSHNGQRMVASGNESPLIWNVTASPENPPATQPAITVDSLGARLANRDAKAAYETARELVKRGDEAVRWIDQHVRPAELPDAAKLFEALSDPDEFLQAKAEYELRSAGAAGVKALRDAAAKGGVDAKRLADLAAALSGPALGSAAALQSHRAAWVLEQIDSPDARHVLKRIRSTPRSEPAAVLEPATRVLATFGEPLIVHGGRQPNLVALAPPGELVATGGGEPIDVFGLSGSALDPRLIVKLWNPTTSRLVHELVGHWSVPTALTFSPRGDRLASADDDLILLWNPQTGQRERHWSGHRSAVRSLAFSEDGSRLLSGAEDGTLRLWDAARGTRLVELAADQKGLFAVSLSGNGKLAASLASGVVITDPFQRRRRMFRDQLESASEVRVWDAETGKSVVKLPIDKATCVAVDPRGEQLAVGSAPSEVIVFALPSGEVRKRWKLATRPNNNDFPARITWQPDGTLRIKTPTSVVRLSLNADDPRVLANVPGSEMSADGRFVAHVTPNGLRVVDSQQSPAADQQPVRQQERRYLFSPDSRRLYVGGGGGPLEIYDATTGTMLGKSTANVVPTAVSPDGRFLCGLTDRDQMGVFEVATGSLVQELGRLGFYDRSRTTSDWSPQRLAAFVAGGREAIFVSDNRVMRLNLTTGEMPEPTVLSGDRFATTDISPDGELLLQTEWPTGRLRRVVEARTGKERWTEKSRTPSGDFGVRFVSNHHALVPNEQGLSVIDIRDGRVQHTWKEATSSPWFAVIDGGQTLVGRYADHFAVWSPSGEFWSVPTSPEKTKAMIASPDGKRLLTRGVDGVVTLWQFVLPGGPATAQPSSRRRDVHFHRTTALLLAANHGRIEQVRALIATGNAIHTPDDRYGSPLHVAAWQGHAAICDLLVQHGADVQATRDLDQATPLHLAAQSRRAEIVKTLLARGAKTDVVDGQRNSPLHHAAEAGSAEIVDLLLAAGCPVDARNENEATPLLLAARAGDQACVLRLIEAGAALDGAFVEGRSALEWAAVGGHEAIVRLLIEKGAALPDDLGQPALTPEQRRDPAAVTRRLVARGTAARKIEAAVRNGEIENVREFLSALPDAVRTRTKGQTLLGIAVLEGRREVVELLLERGADPDARNVVPPLPGRDEFENGKDARPGTVVHLAIRRQDVALARRLLDAGGTLGVGRPAIDAAALAWELAADKAELLRFVDELVLREAKADPSAFLSDAVQAGREDVVAQLLAAKADPNRADVGDPPLFRAIETGNIAILKRLLDAGVKLDQRDDQGLLPLLAAVLAQKTDVVKLLVERGMLLDVHSAAALGDVERLRTLLKADPACVKAMAGSYGTPLHLAAQYERLEAVKLLLDSGADPKATSAIVGRTPLEVVRNPAIIQLLKERGGEAAKKPDREEEDLTGAFRCYGTFMLPGGTIAVDGDNVVYLIANVGGRRLASFEIDEAGVCLTAREFADGSREIIVRGRRDGRFERQRFTSWDDVKNLLPGVFELYSKYETRLEAETLQGNTVFRGGQIWSAQLPWPLAGVAGRDVADGCEVTQVGVLSPAAQAGIQVGDVITSIGRFRCPGFSGLQNLVARHEIGQRVPFGLRRGEQRLMVDVVLGKR